MPSSILSLPLTANSVCQQALYRRWHRYRAKCQILRSQLGFNEIEPSRPSVCRGCIHYHGKAYGQSRDSRTYLICGFHPYGWTDGEDCPDYIGV